MSSIDSIFSELAQYKRIQEETSAIIEGLQEKIKEYMTAGGLDVLQGLEHKATYKEVKQAPRLDAKALQQAHPDIAAQYMKQGSSYKRFTFN